MLTNRHSLPSALARAIEIFESEYDGNNSDRTVSSLHEPPRVVLLRQKHKGDISADVSERLLNLLGSAFHKIAEIAAGDNVIVEKRYFVDVLGWNISGKIDQYIPGEKKINDFKVQSVWAVTVGNALEEHTKKLNTYAYILRENDLAVEKLSATVFFRDWSAREARHNADYPQQQCIEYELEVWPAAKAEAYVMEKVAYHQNAQIAFDRDGVLPTCTPEEQWAKPSKRALMKAGAKRASKLFDAGEPFEVPKGYHVEERPGELSKCMFYCSVRSHCEVGKALEMAAEQAY